MNFRVMDSDQSLKNNLEDSITMCKMFKAYMVYFYRLFIQGTLYK